MGLESQRWKDRWRRYGPLGFVAKAALKASEGSLGMSVEAQYTAPLDSVVAALSGADIDDDLHVRVLKGRKKRSDLLARIRSLNPGFASDDLTAFDRVATAEASGYLVGYWCFTMQDGNLYERGVAVAGSSRGQGIAGRLLLAAVLSMGTEVESARLMATSDLFNRASRRMLERCGLQLDGLMTRGRLPLMGEFHLMWRPPG